MSDVSTLALTRSFTFELYEFLRAIDVLNWREEVIVALSNRLESIEERRQALMEGAEWAERELAWARGRLEDIAAVVEMYAPSPSLPRRAARRQWRLFRRRLLPAYESLARELRERAISVPSIRPTNYARIVTHMTGMSIILAFLASGASITVQLSVIGAIVGFAWTCEISRRRSQWINKVIMAFFRPIAHPQEWHRINSSTWYSTAVFLLALLNVPLVSAAGIIALGLGDPVAGLVGRRFGRIRLLEHRTLEGSLAFLFSSALGITLYISLIHPTVGWTAKIAVALAAAVTGAFTELLSRRLDDNLTVPLTAALAAAITATLFGIGL